MKAGMMGLILAALFWANCFSAVDNSVEPSNGTVVESEESEMMSVSQSEDIAFQIRDYLMGRLQFGSEDALLGAAQRLSQAGCAEAAELELIDDVNGVYVIRLKDIDGRIFQFNIDHDGYIGPIRDEQGNYLYTPIE